MSEFRRIRAVVFDLDGTMLNTEDIFEDAGQVLMERRGLTMTNEIRREMLGRRPAEAFAALKRLTGITDDTDALMRETKEIFRNLAVDRITVLPGVRSLLELTEALELPRAVATSSPEQYMRWLMELVDLYRHFQFVLTAENVQQGKPHPEIYLLAAERLGIAAAEMLVLEDSETGVRAAASAGAQVVAVPNRHTEYGDFSEAILRVESLEDERIAELLQRYAVGEC
ncbi:MAG: HAD family hydrolase [Planctomycetaceae bacterium]|jgi:HAD superfamily hydrolase (TIGR01509 family)